MPAPTVLARKLRLPMVASNGVRYARAEDKALYDVLTSIRNYTHLDAAGRRLGVARWPDECGHFLPDHHPGYIHRRR